MGQRGDIELAMLPATGEDGAADPRQPLLSEETLRWTDLEVRQLGA